MEFLNLKRGRLTFYEEDASSATMEILGGFLQHDVGCYLPSYKEWFLDETQDMTAGNVTSIDKEGEFVLLTSLIYGEDNESPELWIKIDEIVKILDEWEWVCKEKPKEVMIIKEGDAYRVETKN